MYKILALCVIFLFVNCHTPLEDKLCAVDYLEDLSKQKGVCGQDPEHLKVCWIGEEIVVEVEGVPEVKYEKIENTCDGLDNDCDGVVDEVCIEWIHIDGGTYMMGSPSVGRSDERPQHQVTISSFKIMKTEVTVGQYRACVNAGECSEPDANSEYCNWDKSNREDHPVNCIDWFQINEFAQWVGGRLPSEAEFEYVARSRGQDITYPWGNDEPTCNLVVYDGSECGLNGTLPVCSKTAGNSKQGVCDLSGNVREWVQDEYHSSYNGAPTDGSGWCETLGCPSKNASKSSSRVGRGGGWNSDAYNLRSAVRDYSSPTGRYSNIGGRLVQVSPLNP